ncbi:hypothetical protein GOODEAATRI_032225, partial [Goodea atripinnis]
ITAEELTGNDDYIELSFSARKLDDKDAHRPPTVLGLTSSLCLPQTVMNNLNPVWKTFKVSLNSLCSGDQERKLQVKLSPSLSLVSVDGGRGSRLNLDV